MMSLSIVVMLSIGCVSSSNTTLSDVDSVPLKLFDAVDNLEVKVWAQSPMFYNPTNMDIDAKGRIWVAEGINYRKVKSREEGDRIVVLEDTDKDGTADKSHVFIQDKELIAPLGISVIDNKIVVAQPPHLIVYTDVNRDLKFDPKVDKRENILSGFDGSDHDHSLHSVTVGPNGQWYFNIGNAGSGVIKDKSNKTFRIGSFYMKEELSGKKSDDGHVYVGGTAFRMNPDGTNLNVIGFNFRNSYEQTLTSFGDVFHNDNDDPANCRTTWLMEHANCGYASNNGLRQWHNDLRPGQSDNVAHWRQENPGCIPAGDVYGSGSPTGIVFYENGALGKKYRGMLLSCEPALNVVFGYRPQSKDSGFELVSNRFDFLTSNINKKYRGTDYTKWYTKGEKVLHDPRDTKSLFRPSDVAVGPDGAIYVADWFDSRIGGHSTFDKKGSGTIYRIAPKGFKPKVPEIDLSTVAGQIDALLSPAVNVRAIGFYELIKQGDKAIDLVKKLLEHENIYFRARAVWVLSNLGANGLREVESLLKSDDDNIRIVAFRALKFQQHNFIQHAAVLSKDRSVSVRRELALSLRDVAFDECAPILINIAEGFDGKDRWYLEALGTGCSGKEARIYPLIKKRLGVEDALKWDDRFEGIAWRLHVNESVDDFKRRALSDNISESKRIKMLTALAFVKSIAAADAMIEISKKSKSDNVRQMAKWWMTHPEHDFWKEHKELKRYFQPTKITMDYLVPKSMGAVSQLPDDKTILALTGDAKKGKMQIARCVMCHQVNGTGVNFGPDITNFGKTQTREVILKSLTDPSRDVSHNFRARQIEMKNGKIIQGFLMSVSKKTISIKVFGGQIIAVDRDEVKVLKMIVPSLMIPASKMGFKAQELRDLVEYMKVGKLD